MIKVCILTCVHAPFDIRIFYKEGRSLKRAGYDVSLLAQHDKEEIVDGIRIVPLPKPKSRLERMTKTAWLVYRKSLKINADIYHFHDPELIPVGLLLRFHGKRVIYDVHEDVPEQILSKNYIPVRSLVSKFVNFVEKKTSRKFDAVICSTEIIKNNFANRNLYTIWNYPLLNEIAFQNIPWNRRRRNVCYIGSISRIRGIFSMVNAIGRTNARLILGGNFTNQSLFEKVSSMQGWRRTNYLGYLGRESVNDVLSCCVAGLHVVNPLKRHLEGIPTKMFEYMAAGIPVIITDSPFWEEIVLKEECGIFVDALSPEKISTAVQWVVDHPQEAKEMGINGRRAVEERYNWNMEEKKLLAIYHSVIQG